MGKRARRRPVKLARKLLAIRRHLGLSQSEMAQVLGLIGSYGRVSEYETNSREPDLITLLRYAQTINRHVDDLIDDNVKLKL